MERNESKIVELYVEQRWSLRRIAKEFNTDHHTIKRMLERNNIEITNANRARVPMSFEHRQKISETSKGRIGWNRGKKMPESFRRKNMQARIGTTEDFSKYADYDRLLMLSRLYSKRQTSLNLENISRTDFFDKFYFDKSFNAIYDKWIGSNKLRWWYPSLDHIHPQARKGSWQLEDLQFLTWFENRAKADMPQEEWESFKQATNTRSDLFIESILNEKSN